ncbi:MAG: EpsG family protein [Psychrilyobacter sp.]|uniref:EpsG family protein n=1 Tax=Psychrilyobacter sp. TaxID=2586924 RepID=UPI003C742693
MLVYIYLYVLGITQVLIRKQYIGKLLRLLLSLSLIVVTVYRNDLGADYNSYKNYFNAIDSSMEIGYKLINLFWFHITGNYKFVLLTTVLINLFNIHKGSKIFKIDFNIVLFSYLCLFYFSHNFNIIRHGLMSSFLFVAYAFWCNNENRKAYIYILIGSLFHRSVFFIFIILPLTKIKKYRIQLLILALLITKLKILELLLLFIYKYSPFPDINHKIYYYLFIYPPSIIGYTKGFYLKLIIALIILLGKFKLRKTKIFGIYFLSLLLFILLNNQGVFHERIVNMLYVVDLVFILLFLDEFFEKYKNKRLLIIMSLIGYLSLYFFRIILSKDADGIYNMIPYIFKFSLKEGS